ncbi:Iai11p PWA37_004329 [Arxiozyma heterogenica]|uniref:Iai11p n=1 Tax=Arxiozyma heterogenica TaxID=278026 RepID=UPI002EE4B834
MDSLYKERRKQQMLRFFGATTLTLISCRFMMKFLTPRVESPLVNNLVKKQCMSKLLLSFPLFLFIYYRDK